MEYQKEQLFFAYITAGHFGEHRITKAVIHVTCAKHKRFGLKIEDVYCSLQEPNQWYKMEPKTSENSELLQHFTVQFETLEFSYQRNFEIIFDIKTVCTIENYHYELMDENWCKDLWAAAINKKLTDVEIFVGTFKLMEAHRVILCARSPVLNSSLISNAEKSIVTFGVEFDKDVLHYFLKFLYTGRLKVCPKVMQMSQLAAMYEVETLKNICQLLIASPPDAEQVTNYLLEL
jgi:speckle-type POZ protein